MDQVLLQIGKLLSIQTWILTLLGIAWSIREEIENIEKIEME